jgi:hypothetical protein
LALTQAFSDSSTKAATTAFVKTSFAPLASPPLTGAPTAPTQAPGDATTKLATDAFVAAALTALITTTGTTNGAITIGPIIINYGQLTTPGSSPTVISYTTPYATRVFAVVPYCIDAFQEYDIASGFGTDLNNFTLNFGAAGSPIGWIAIGI